MYLPWVVWAGEKRWLLHDSTRTRSGLATHVLYILLVGIVYIVGQSYSSAINYSQFMLPRHAFSYRLSGKSAYAHFQQSFHLYIRYIITFNKAMGWVLDWGLKVPEQITFLIVQHSKNIVCTYKLKSRCAMLSHTAHYDDATWNSTILYNIIVRMRWMRYAFLASSNATSLIRQYRVPVHILRLLPLLAVLVIAVLR